MNATSHLAMLRQIFPDKFVLDIAEVATVLGCSKKRLYVLSSKKELPFARLPGFRFHVMLVELARYLDEASALVGVGESVRANGEGFARTDDLQEIEGQRVKKKRVGRPRKIDRVLPKKGKSC